MPSESWGWSGSRRILRGPRCFDTLQNRLVKALRKARVNTVAEANQYLQQRFLPDWQERFTVAAASSVNAHRPLGVLQLVSILSFAEPRTISPLPGGPALAGPSPTGARGAQLTCAGCRGSWIAIVAK